MSDVLAALVEANLAATAAVAAVLLLRLPVRRLFGPEVAYGLWALPVLAAAATLIPARTEPGAVEPAALAAAFSGLLVPLWLVGGAATAALFGLAQARFLKAARAGRGGPAVVGVIAPRLVMPADDGTFSPEERALIRAHEREHIVRADPRAGAAAAALQCLFWFNPLAHVAAYLMRLDQELACDAAVVRKHKGQRALYAKTLLKTQLAAQPLPFGCQWPARGVHPLEVRVGLLRATRRDESVAGPLLVASAALIAAAGAWAAQPPLAPPKPKVMIWDRADDRPHTSVLLIRMPARATPST